MQSMKFKKRISRIIAGLVSAAMTFTMVPDVWLPVHAEIVRDDILNADISQNTESNELTSDPMDGYEYTIYEFGGHKYAYVSNVMLWNEAKNVCEGWGGHLAYVDSAEENDFLRSINTSNYVALGGWDEPCEGNWTWIDGSKMTYANWNPGEPNNGSHAQNHLYMYSSGKWDDGYNDIRAPFICEWGVSVQSDIGKISEYTVFSANQNEDITLNGWKANFTGGIYSGRNFVCNLSEFYLDGNIDAAGTVTANGWQINIPEKNENVDAISMPDLEKAILEKAGEYTYYSESPSYIQDTNIINGSIMVSGDVTISGTNFEGDCYIIADKDITYNVNNLNTTGRLVLYSRNGNITVNGTNISIDGIMYAPKGKVSFNANETTVNGRVWADTVNLSGSIFNIKGSDSDLDLLGRVDTPQVSEAYVELKFDKEAYSVGDDVTVTVEAYDTKGVAGIALEYDGEQVMLDSSNSYCIKGITAGEHTLVAIAWNSAGEVISEGYIINILPAEEYDTIPPELTVTYDKTEILIGEKLPINIDASDNSGVVDVKIEVDDEPVSYDGSGIFTFESDKRGIYEITVYAYDPTGNSRWESVKISVKTEDDFSAPTIELSLDKEIYFEGDNIIITVKAADNIGVTNTVVTVNGEALSADENGRFVIKNAAVGTYDIKATAYDAAGNSAWTSVSVPVNNKGSEPADELTLEVDIDTSKVKVGEPFDITITANGGVGEKIISCTVNNESVAVENSKATYTPAQEGIYDIAVSAVDEAGSNITKTIKLTISESGADIGGGEEPDDPDDDVLYVDITSPEDIKEITAPTDIIGSAKGSGLVKYTLEYAPAGTDEFTAICEGTEAVDGSVIGQLDTTMLRNGYYDIRLTGYTSKAHKSDIITVYITGQMKIGNFSIAFQDMDVNVPGLALTVVRGYDSRDKSKSGDFGYGWNLSMTNADISESGKPSENWSHIETEGMFGSTFKLQEDKAHEVSIDWGNGKTEKFRMALSPNSSLTPITAGITVSYKAVNGIKSELKAINKSSTELIFNSGLLMYSDLTPYKPDGYILTKQDGTVYYFDADGNVTKIIDTNGSTIEMTYDGIIHSDGKSINYNRDSEGRITSIESPTGKTVEYTYDNNGDLTAVKDISGYVTKFEYDEHYITNIIDPRGVSVSRNIYDDSGRLIKTIDSDGNEIVYDHDIDGRQEIITDRNGNVTLYVYDDNGNILSQTDPNGNTVKNTYDSNGNLDKTIDALGNVTDYGYSENGDLLTLTDAEGHTVTNSYNSKGQLTSINAMGINTITVAYDDKGNTTSTTDALGNDIDYSYDGKGQLTSVTDEIGSYMNMTYDSEGNVVSATNGAGTTSNFTYDDDGNCTSKTLTYTSEEGLQTVTENYFYDEAGNLIKIIDSEGNVTSTEYNSMGKVSSATDEKGRKTSYDYDDFGNLVKITYPDNTTETFTYDREGNNLSATDRMGRTVTMTYDKVGNLTAKTYPNGARVTYTYDANYNLISETSASGGVTYYKYDKIGRNTAIVDALGNRTTFFYNAKSQLESMTDPMGRTYTYSYDDNGNRIKTTYPNGTSVSSVYDARGRVTRQTDQHGYNTYYVYDGADRLVRVTNAQGVSTSYTYDEVGNMTSVTDGNGNVTAYAYDDFGRVVKTTNALGGSAYTTYDKSGNVLTSTDYAGNVTSYTYDSLDRLSSKQNNDGTVNYTYTADGKISTVTDSTGTTMFTYDLMDGLKRVDYPDGNYVEYSYDKACRLTSVTTPFGSTSYEYDLLDRLTRVVDRNGYATIYEYDSNGNRTAVHYANGLTTTYDYDLLNRLICEKTIDIDGDIVVQYIYTLGVAGERKAVTELDRTVEYTYDSLYRLTSETITEGEKVTAYTYAYDNVSNRILKTENGTETEYVYNALNQLVSDSNTSYEYDLNGNLVRVIGSAQSALYEYNAENKIVKATVQNGSLVIEESYTYDYEGNRTSKSTHKSNGEFEYTKYLNDNSSLTNVLAETDSEGNALALYTVGADLVSQERDGKVSVYLYDGHGSVVGLANESGVVTDTYCYDAFGNLLKSTGSTANNYRYCGEQFDETTGLYYLRARYMDTSTGRFISQDSYQGNINDPVSLHKYLYANANPVTYSDPSGYFVAQARYLQEESQEAQRCLSVFRSLVNQIKGAVIEVGKKSVVQQVAATFGTVLAGGIIQAVVDITILNVLESTCVYGTKIANAMMAYGNIGSLIRSAAQDIEKYGNYHNNLGEAVHHIVQENYSLAEPARKRLRDSWVNICENYTTVQLNKAEPYEPNLLKIKTLTHRAIHSQLCNTVYTLWVNSIMESTPHVNGAKLVNFFPTVASLTFIAGVIKSVDETITPST